MRGSQAIGTIVGRITSAVVQRDMVYVESSATTNAEAMDRIVLNVYVVN